VCDHHAASGAHIAVFYEANETGDVQVDVHGAVPALTRVTEIAQPEGDLAEALRPDLET
jgi:hypothetical protein